MKILFVVVGIALSFSLQTLADEESSSLMATCKADCPKAKNDDEAHKCVEKKGRLNKDFRKSKCWEVNEEYEKKAAASKTEK